MTAHISSTIAEGWVKGMIQPQPLLLRASVEWAGKGCCSKLTERYWLFSLLAPVPIILHTAAVTIGCAVLLQFDCGICGAKSRAWCRPDKASLPRRNHHRPRQSANVLFTGLHGFLSIITQEVDDIHSRNKRITGRYSRSRTGRVDRRRSAPQILRGEAGERELRGERVSHGIHGSRRRCAPAGRHARFSWRAPRAGLSRHAQSPPQAGKARAATP